MKIETKLSCGDKVWYFSHGEPHQITVGQVRVEFTKSKGLQRGECFVGQVLSSDNTLPKTSRYEERYMCIETGVDSGSIHELGRTIFLTEADCLAGNSAEIKRMAEAAAWREQKEREDIAREEALLRERLRRLEEKKLTPHQ
jgi:hypothetical protein